MPIVPAKCTQCGAKLEIDSSSDAAICKYCGMPFVVEKAINNYNNTFHITNVFNGANVTVVEKRNTVSSWSKEEWREYKDKFMSCLEKRHYNYDKMCTWYECITDMWKYVKSGNDVYELLPELLECELMVKLVGVYFGTPFSKEKLKEKIIEITRTAEEERSVFVFIDETIKKYDDKYIKRKAEAELKKAEERKVRTELIPEDAEDINEFIGNRKYVGIDERTGKKTVLEKYELPYRASADSPKIFCVRVSFGFWTSAFFFPNGWCGRKVCSEKYRNAKLSREFICKNKWNLIFEYDYVVKGKLKHFVNVLKEM